jgi:hypothetical protein
MTTSAKPPDATHADHTRKPRRWAALWFPGLLVALGAAVTTAHGLFEVARAATVPAGIAVLYPLITDGLALVAYASTARLSGQGRRYAWTVVILAAGLSGLAQATYLAGGVGAGGVSAAGAMSTPPAVRFGVGAWPAIAAAIVAHLLFLLGTQADTNSHPSTVVPSSVEPVQPQDEHPKPVQSAVVQPDRMTTPVQPSGSVSPAQPSGSVQPASVSDGTGWEPGVERRAVSLPSPARDRARTAARHYVAHHGTLPTVSQLMDLAEVSRGTAAIALQHVREHPADLRVIAASSPTRTEP